MKSSKQKIILKGVGASSGIIKGKAKILNSPNEVKKVQRGDILVVSMSNPLYTPAIMRAAGMITDYGGILSHPAIIAREMAMPCVVGTVYATRILRDNMDIVVDGGKGIIYETVK